MAEMKKERIYFVYMPLAVLLLVIMNLGKIVSVLNGNWVPYHDTRTNFAEFLYAVSALQEHELPLWNSYIHGGEPFYLFMNHSHLLNPVAWLWIIIGTLFEMKYMDIYVYLNLTNVVFFALGGFFFVRELLRNNYAGIAAFIIFLYSGEPMYWAIQAFSLSTVIYVPWVLFFGLRYLREQTLARALAFACLFGIATNVYYTLLYLLAFLGPFFLLTLIFRFDAIRQINYTRLLKHAIPSLMIIGLSFLPTYMDFHEIKTNYHQVGRFKNKSQETSLKDRQEQTFGVSRGNYDRIYPGMFLIEKNCNSETVPFIGIFAFLFVFLGMGILGKGSMSRTFLVWSGTFVLVLLNYLGWLSIYHYLSFTLIPGFPIIRSYGFFSGYLIVIATVLACRGIALAMQKFYQEDTDSTRISFWKNELLLLPLFFYTVTVLPPDDRYLPLVLAFIIIVTVVNGYSRKKIVVMQYKHLLLVSFLLIGMYNLHFITNLPCQKEKNWIFRYASDFDFSFTRPHDYLVKTPEGKNPDGYPFFQTANRNDGPYAFEGWGTMEVLLISKLYTEFSSHDGLDKLMTQKLHFFKNYAVIGNITETVTDFEPFLDKAVLIVDNDESITNRKAKVNSGDVPAMPDKSPITPETLLLVKKTANTVIFDVTIPENLFLLYTDLYDKDFVVLVDGVKAPLLKGMGFLKAVELAKGRHIVEFTFRPLYGLVLLSYLVFAFAFLCFMAIWGGMAAYKYFRP